MKKNLLRTAVALYLMAGSVSSAMATARDFVINLTQQQCYFSPDDSTNKHVNKIKIVNGDASGNTSNGISSNDILLGTSELRFYRAVGDTEVRLATVKLTKWNWLNYKTYYYTLTMLEPSGSTESTDGSFTAAGAGKPLDFSSLEITDNFNEKVTSDSQPADYRYYVVYFHNAIAGYSYSDTVTLQSPKPAYSLSYSNIGGEELYADTTHTAALSDVKATLDVNVNPFISSYSLVNFTTNTQVASIMPTADGSAYVSYERGADGVINQEYDSVATPADTAWLQIECRDDLRDVVNAKAVDYYSMAVDSLGNTYGGLIHSVGTINLSLTGEPQLLKTYPQYNKSLMGYQTQFDLTGIYNADTMEPCGFRVWRVNGDAETLIVDQINNVTNDSVSTLSVKDLFLDSALTEGEQKVVGYIVRFYTAANDAPNKYYVTESNFEVTFDEATATGISDVTADAEVQNVTYVNALGQRSSRPFSGFNVVVTTYTNGATTQVKKLIP